MKIDASSPVFYSVRHTTTEQLQTRVNTHTGLYKMADNYTYQTHYHVCKINVWPWDLLVRVELMRYQLPGM